MSFDSDFLRHNEMKGFRKSLTVATEVCTELARKLKCQLFVDSRWPASGIKKSSLFKLRYIRVTLNPNFLSDNKIFFEIRDHTVTRIPFISCSLTAHRVVNVLSVDQIEQPEVIENALLQALQHHA